MQSRLGSQTRRLARSAADLADAVKPPLQRGHHPDPRGPGCSSPSRWCSFPSAFLVYVTILGLRLVVKDPNIGVVYLAAVTSIAVIGIVLGAWASNSYALVSPSAPPRRW